MSKIAPLSYISRINQNNRISYNNHIFPGLFGRSGSVAQRVQAYICFALSFFCHNFAPFDILYFSNYFFHFAADFVTILYTKMAIFPTLSYTASLKKASLSGGASP